MAQATVQEDVVDRLRDEVLAPRDLVFEKVDAPTTASSGEVHMEKANYVVNPSRQADARVVADVLLRHK